jgi:hypothetical protein
MINALIQLHDKLPLLLQWLFDFAFEIIFLRGIIAPKIVSDIEHTGFKKINIIHDMVHVINMIIPPKDSRQAISEHFTMRAQGIGHEAGSISGCYDGSCGKLLAA